MAPAGDALTPLWPIEYCPLLLPFFASFTSTSTTDRGHTCCSGGALRPSAAGDETGDHPREAREVAPQAELSPFCKMAQAGHPHSWSDLPTELAGLVLSRLPAYSDRVRFGAVCRHWSFSFSSMKRFLPKPLPCLGCPDGTFFCLPHSESCKFPDIMSYHSSCGERLVFIHDGTCYLKDPFSKSTLTLPNLSCLGPIHEPVEIINGRVNPEDEIPEESLNMDANMSIHKVIMCSTSIVAATVNIGPHKTVALCRPGGDSWLVSGLGSKVSLFDMMFYEGKLYVVDESKDLLVIIVGEDNDNGKLSISRIEHVIDTKSFSLSLIHNGVSFFHYFLVECNGALLLLSQTIHGIPSDDDSDWTSIKPVGHGFEVFKADFRSSQWEDVKSVGDDMVLFVSKNYSQSVSVSQYKKLKGNCIWFLDDGSCSWFWKDVARSCAIYDMSDERTYAPLPEGSFKSEKAPVTWVVPH